MDQGAPLTESPSWEPASSDRALRLEPQLRLVVGGAISALAERDGLIAVFRRGGEAALFDLDAPTPSEPVASGSTNGTVARATWSGRDLWTLHQGEEGVLTCWRTQGPELKDVGHVMVSGEALDLFVDEVERRAWVLTRQATEGLLTRFDFSPTPGEGSGMSLSEPTTFEVGVMPAGIFDLGTRIGVPAYGSQSAYVFGLRSGVEEVRWEIGFRPFLMASLEDGSTLLFAGNRPRAERRMGDDVVTTITLPETISAVESKGEHLWAFSGSTGELYRLSDDLGSVSAIEDSLSLVTDLAVWGEHLVIVDAGRDRSWS